MRVRCRGGGWASMVADDGRFVREQPIRDAPSLRRTRATSVINQLVPVRDLI